MKRTFFVLLLLCITLQVFAARVMNQPVTITQPDGTVLNVLASGDEFHNWLHDSRNFTIIQNKQTGWYTWAIKTGSDLTPSNYLVGQSDPAALGIQTGLNLSAEQLRNKPNPFTRFPSSHASTRIPHIGTINNLVIFIKFSDSPEFQQTIPFYDNLFNNSTPGYDSMHNYFQAVSYGQLDITTHYFPIPNNDIIVCYTDSLPRGYYMPLTGSNPIGYDEESETERTEREFSLLTNASNYVASQVPTTLNLDGDGDGNVDNVCFTVQGSTTAWATLLWPHRWSLYNSTAYINGAMVYDFNFQLESFLNGEGASVLCHEMTHSLGAPDYYRYYDGTIDPIGSWDLMCGNTSPPQSMSAWIKSRYLGWVDNVPNLTTSGDYSLHSVWSQTNNIYRIPSWRANEYYVLEYRKPFGIYDTEIPGSGLLIYRLNTTVEGNADGPPDELYLYRPEGINTTTQGSVNQANFSLQSGRTFMNETTSPNGFLSDDSPGGLDISQIGATGGDSITFHVNISNVQVTFPVGGETFFGGDVQTVTWKARTQTGYAKIEFSQDNGLNWQTLSGSTPNNGTFNWLGVPIIDSDLCLIRVTTLNNNAVDVCNRTFSILSTIGIPVPTFPTDLMIGAPTNPTFSWDVVPGASSYTLQVGMDSLFNSLVIDVVDITNTSYIYNNLMPFTTYYWHLAAFAPIGPSNYCATQQFTTGDISILPGVPSLLLPANNSTNQLMNPVLQWNPSAYAHFYHYQVSQSPYFSNLIQEDDSLAATQIQLQLLAANTHYYWRVRARNAAGFSYFSNIRNFTTGTTSPNGDNPMPEPVNALYPNQPNPFSTFTQIEFSLKDTSRPARLSVYNTKGQLVRTLWNGRVKSGSNQISWNGKDNAGNTLTSGIYYYRLQSVDYTRTQRMLLLK